MTKQIKKQLQDFIRMTLWCALLSILWTQLSFEIAVIVALSQIVAKVESWDVWGNKD